MLCGQRKSHRTRTKQWNPSVMFSSITHNCIPAIVCSQHTRLISSNRLCSYRSSHTFLITDMFASYHTHLVHLNCFYSHVSTQTVHPSEPHAVYRTHLWSGWPFLLCCLITSSSSEWTVCCTSHTPLIWLTASFVLPNHKQFIPVNRMLCIAHSFIWMPISFVPPRRKQLIELNRMPYIAHVTKTSTMFEASVIANVLYISDGFHTPPFAIMASFLEGSLIVVSC